MSERTRESARADRAASLKEAAIEVFAEHGYHKAKVSMIVGRVGVAQGTFYLYYKGKREIFGEILGDFLGIFQDVVAAMDIGQLETEEGLRDALVRLGESLIVVLMENQKLTRVFFQEALAVHPEFTKQIDEFFEDFTDVMTGINRLNFRRGLIREQDFRVLTYCTLGMIERNIQEFVVKPDVLAPKEELKKVVEHIVDLFLFGATPRG